MKTRWIEFLCLFAGLPALLYFDLVRVPRIPALLLVTLGILWILVRDPSFDRRMLWTWQAPASAWRSMALRGMLAMVLIAGLAAWLVPDHFFNFPRRRPLLWALVMTLYPVLSAYPQELVYRVFFFHRYAPLFGGGSGLVWASAAAFAALHLIYDNPVAILLSFAGGLLFARAYRAAPSVGPIALEHALYGCWIFTAGLGRFFHEGALR